MYKSSLEYYKSNRNHTERDQNVNQYMLFWGTKMEAKSNQQRHRSGTKKEQEWNQNANPLFMYLKSSQANCRICLVHMAICYAYADVLVHTLDHILVPLWSPALLHQGRLEWVLGENQTSTPIKFWDDGQTQAKSQTIPRGKESEMRVACSPHAQRVVVVVWGPRLPTSLRLRDRKFSIDFNF